MKQKFSGYVKNLIGQQYGKLIVTEFVGTNNHQKSLWKCLCDCGKERIVVACHLSKTKSCGCTKMSGKVPRKDKKIPNLVGKTYGNFTIKKHCGKKDNRNIWLCECSQCMKTKKYSISEIKEYRTCGYKIRHKDRENHILRQNYKNLKRRHKKKFDIKYFFSFEEYKRICSLDCFYCGKQPKIVLKDIRSRGGLITDTIVKVNTIDRVDSSIGYVDSNVVPCCLICNKAKLDTSMTDFLDWVKRVNNYSNKELF